MMTRILTRADRSGTQLKKIFREGRLTKKVSISVVDPDPYVFGPPASDPSLFCTNLDPSIKKQKNEEKP
jgi:hypothetical protein